MTITVELMNQLESVIFIKAIDHFNFRQAQLFIFLGPLQTKQLNVLQLTSVSAR